MSDNLVDDLRAEIANGCKERFLAPSVSALVRLPRDAFKNVGACHYRICKEGELRALHRDDYLFPLSYGSGNTNLGLFLQKLGPFCADGRGTLRAAGPKIFISYAREDYVHAKRLYDELRAMGFDVWLDRESLLPGQKWKKAIEEAIRECDCFIVLISKKAVKKIGYVQNELRKALDIFARMPEHGIYLIPARLNKCLPSHSALLGIQWVDLFPDWSTGMAKILRALESLSNAGSSGQSAAQRIR